MKIRILSRLFLPILAAVLLVGLFAFGASAVTEDGRIVASFSGNRGETVVAEILTEEERRDYRLPEDRRNLAKGRIWLATLLQMTLPGVPCIYYGDEAGPEGYADPYNRGTFPWGKEDKDLETIYRNAIALRRLDPVFTDGAFTPFALGADVFGFYRDTPQTHAAVLVNRSLSDSRQADLPAKGGQADEIVNGFAVTVENGRASIALPPMSAAVIFFR